MKKRIFLTLLALVLFCSSVAYAALPSDINTREYNKFQETASGDVAILVTSSAAPSAATDYYDNRKVVASAGTAEALVAATKPFSWCTVQAEDTNTGDIVIGASTVVEADATRRGIRLLPGEAFHMASAGDLLYVYIDSEVNGDGVHYFCQK